MNYYLVLLDLLLEFAQKLDEREIKFYYTYIYIVIVQGGIKFTRHCTESVVLVVVYYLSVYTTHQYILLIGIYRCVY